MSEEKKHFIERNCDICSRDIGIGEMHEEFLDGERHVYVCAKCADDEDQLNSHTKGMVIF